MLPSGEDVAASIRRRFEEGHATSNLQEAGVLLHMFDGQEGTIKLNSGWVDPAVWMPCSEPKWCGKFADRFAASLVYKGMDAIFTGGPGAAFSGGIIFRPSFVKILCSFPADGGTMSITCEPPGVRDDCVPGCRNAVRSRGWCGGVSGDLSCPYAPEDLGNMLRAWENTQYGRSEPFNEVIIDAAHYVSHLPQSVEAFVDNEEARL